MTATSAAPPEPPAPAADSSPPTRRRPGAGAILALLGLVAVLVTLGIWIAPHVTREHVAQWVRGAGVWGPVVLLAVQVGQILVAPIPGVFVPLLAGLFYGPVVGPVVTGLGTLLGSGLAYAVGRRAGSLLVERWIGQESLERAGRLMQGKRWLALVPLFLMPASPSDAICFAAGILRLDWRRFGIAVALGRVPKDALLAIGAALGWGALFGS
jgi:uncharacterized membrane protein YdjX (TVP38/TMEM64 family)